MKYNKIDNNVWQAEIIVIEALAKVELLEEQLKGTSFKVTGVTIHSSTFTAMESRVTEGMLSTLSRSTGLEINTQITNDEKKILYLVKVEQKEE